jgi:hypothetical protein
MRCRARIWNLRRARVESGVFCLRRLPTHCPQPGLFLDSHSSRGFFFAVCSFAPRSAFGHAARPCVRVRGAHATRGLPRRPRAPVRPVPCRRGSRSGVAVGAGPWGARGAAWGFDLEVVFFDAGTVFSRASRVRSGIYSRVS